MVRGGRGQGVICVLPFFFPLCLGSFVAELALEKVRFTRGDVVGLSAMTKMLETMWLLRSTMLTDGRILRMILGGRLGPKSEDSYEI